MFTSKKPVTFLCTTAILFITCIPVFCQKYIVMGPPHANIRTGPSTDNFVIGKAEKGDIFKVIDTENNWHKILMFSGNHRYVLAVDYVYPLTKEDIVPGHRMVLPTPGKQRRLLCRDIHEAKARAKKEANEIIPTLVDESRNTAVRKILEDRIILELMHIYSFQPAMYDELLQYCQQE